MHVAFRSAAGIARDHQRGNRGSEFLADALHSVDARCATRETKIGYDQIRIAVELAAAAVATIQPLAEQRGQSVKLDAPAGPLLVIGDRPRLDRALLNLVANAQKFAPDDGHIGISVRRLPGERICWAVTDDGPGISAPDRRRLFERFFVGARDARGARDGVGLGLPRALAIAQAHGGNIEVTSRVGHGSTFKLIVPIAGPGEDSL